jgi:hypothetical protein
MKLHLVVLVQAKVKSRQSWKSFLEKGLLQIVVQVVSPPHCEMTLMVLEELKE